MHEVHIFSISSSPIRTPQPPSDQSPSGLFRFFRRFFFWQNGFLCAHVVSLVFFNLLRYDPHASAAIGPNPSIVATTIYLPVRFLLQLIVKIYSPLLHHYFTHDVLFQFARTFPPPIDCINIYSPLLHHHFIHDLLFQFGFNSLNLISI